MLDPSRDPGRHEPLTDAAPRRIFALGMTYRDHASETGFAPDGQPHVFRQHPRCWLPVGDEVAIPSRHDLLGEVYAIERRIARRVARRFARLPALMDYEVELGVMVLDAITPASLADDAFAPPLGYFLANDLTARSVQVLGEGRELRMLFWGAAKSFPGFLPVGETMWIPNAPTPEGLLRVRLVTRVNGEERQNADTSDLVLSPRELLRGIAGRLAPGGFERGDVVLTGTPAGIGFVVPAWKRLVARLLPAHVRLRLALRAHRDNRLLLRAGDEVQVEGGALGTRRVTLVQDGA